MHNPSDIGSYCIARSSAAYVGCDTKRVCRVSYKGSARSKGRVLLVILNTDDHSGATMRVEALESPPTGRCAARLADGLEADERLQILNPDLVRSGTHGHCAFLR